MKLGLKVWSSNRQYFEDAQQFFQEGLYDFIELYIDLNVQDERWKIWKEIGCDVRLHAPHSYGGFNPAESERFYQNRKVVQIVQEYQRFFDSSSVIFHPGTKGLLQETIRQFSSFCQDFPSLFEHVLIENKPKIGLAGENCLGASPEEIRELQSELGFGFCLDVSHLICYAAWVKMDWKNLFEEFLYLNPAMVHLCDGNVESEKDAHLHFGKGNYDLDFIMSKLGSDVMATIETPHDSLENLADFRRDVDFLNNLLRGHR